MKCAKGKTCQQIPEGLGPLNSAKFFDHIPGTAVSEELEEVEAELAEKGLAMNIGTNGEAGAVGKACRRPDSRYYAGETGRVKSYRYNTGGALLVLCDCISKNILIQKSFAVLILRTVVYSHEKTPQFEV